MTVRYFDDFAVGDRFVSDGKTLCEAEILDFGFRYDPQPIHMDTVAAEASQYGGLIASGFQTLVIGFRLMWQTNLFNACSRGSPGMDEVRWLKPVRPGDTLHTEVEVTSLRASKSKPDRGILRLAWEFKNQTGETVMTLSGMHLLRRRPE